MNDHSKLLDQLRIDRTMEAASRSTIWPWLLICGLLVAGAIGAYIRWSGDTPIAVRSATARALNPETTATSVLDASGYVVARRQATVSSKVTGKVTEVLIEEGQAVRQGDVLARIDDSNARAQLALAQSQLQAARTQLTEINVQLAEAERQLRRTRELSERQLVSDQALDSAQASVDGLKARLATTRSNVVVAERSVAVQQQQLDDTVVRAPFDGVITIKNAQPGEMISPLSAGGAGTRTGIGTLVDMRSLEVEVDVNENFINRVESGQKVTARLNAYPDWRIPAGVIAVIPTADRSKATVKVRIGLDVEDPRILPEMGVRVSFMDAAAQSPEPQTVSAGVLIPAEAVHDGEVFVIDAGHVERRAVVTGGSDGTDMIVMSGLRRGERVAIGALSELSDGAKVQVTD